MAKIRIYPNVIKNNPVYYDGFSDSETYDVCYIFTNGDITVKNSKGNERQVDGGHYVLVSV